MINDFRNTLIRKSYKIYSQHLKQTQLGNFLARRVVDIGLISRTDLQIARLLPSDKDVPDSFDHSKYAQEINSEALPNFHLSPPLNFELSEQLSTVSYINVLLPSLRVKHMSGGPNTALLFAILLAERGEHIRLISCDSPAHGEESDLYSHMDSLLKRPVPREKIELVDAFDRSKKVYIGKNDIFFATAWWTAQIAKYGTEKTIYKTFVYLIQDFEPILHEGSTFQARALETYGLPHIPLINTNLLLEHLVQEKAGCYADQDFASKALAFEPALDRNYYFPDNIASPTKNGKKVLLFYARPTVARRNLFEIGIVALRQAVASGAISSEQWEVWAMGEKLPPISLGNGVYLNPLPWLSFEDYAKRVRTADLLLSLMLSPHPSYPPLEMAASGNLVVTNSFSVKTAARMQGFSTNIIVAEPTPTSIASALEKAAGRINAGLPSHDPSGVVNLPTDWENSLQNIIPELLKRLDFLRFSPPICDGTSPVAGSPANPKTSYEIYRKNRLEQRRLTSNFRQEPGLLSFVTSVYNTSSQFLLELGHSLFVQDGGMNFEWLILDNGSTNNETIFALEYLSRYPSVRLERVEDNLGIIGGMRYLLEHAKNQYILPLDSDDLLEPDCVSVITSYICNNDFPPLLYSDEDKVSAVNFHSPYFKPDWDPVLFLHSCYIAHLCAIDREKALALDVYTDKTAEGCHDWDSFIRFMSAGYTPHHIPEVLYSWRTHSGSTSENILSKTYISDSHRETLTRALAKRQAPNVELVPSPLFKYNVDWWFRRKRDSPVSCETLLLTSSKNALVLLADSVEKLDCDLVHLCWEGSIPSDDEWAWEAAALIELFPDAVMAGGTLHDGKTVIGGPCLFGFGNGLDCPDAGRPLDDPGYFAWMHKSRSVSAVSVGHCVVTLSFLKEVVSVLLDEEVAVELLGPWLGALAAERNKRVIFSPFMRAQASLVPEALASPAARSHFLSRFWHLIPDTRFYSEKLGLTRETAYRITSEVAQRNHRRILQKSTLPYHDWLRGQIQNRSKRYPEPATTAEISIITPVYSGSDLNLLQDLASSINSQTTKVSEWIIIVNGVMPEESLLWIQKKSEEEWNAYLIVNPSIHGIIPALRLGLESARGEYVLPIDADDLITPDAIQILVSMIDRCNHPDLLFSDEDLLMGDKYVSPYLRAGFDPVLSSENSVIWHLISVKRDSALAAKVYEDFEANWCQDWDTVLKVYNFGGRIVHIPEVLYHWRRHSKSTTNNSKGDSRSLDSVLYILSQQIARTTFPSRYFVADWPNNRGTRELYIARAAKDLPNFLWHLDFLDDPTKAAEEGSILVYASKNIVIDISTTYLEVTRLFELHPHLGAVGGLTVSKEGLIVDACYVTSSFGTLESPWIGESINYSGPYALALKPQSVASTGSTLAFFRVSALEQTGCWNCSKTTDLSPIMIAEICQKLLQNQWSTCFSPLVRASTSSMLQNNIFQYGKISIDLAQSFAMSRYGTMKNFRD